MYMVVCSHVCVTLNTTYPTHSAELKQLLLQTGAAQQSSHVQTQYALKASAVLQPADRSAALALMSGHYRTYETRPVCSVQSNLPPIANVTLHS